MALKGRRYELLRIVIIRLCGIDALIIPKLGVMNVNTEYNLYFFRLITMAGVLKPPLSFFIFFFRCFLYG